MIRLSYIGKQDTYGLPLDGRLWNIISGGDPMTHPNGSTVTVESLKELGAVRRDER